MGHQLLPFDCWGSPCTDSLDCHHKSPPGVPATIWQGCPGTLQIRQHPGLEDPMRHRILRVFGLDRRFWAFTSAATRADTHTSRRCGVSLSRYHQHRSTMIRPCDPPQRASLHSPLAIAATQSVSVQHAPQQHPLPGKHCCYGPVTPHQLPTCPSRQRHPEHPSPATPPHQPAVAAPARWAG